MFWRGYVMISRKKVFVLEFTTARWETGSELADWAIQRGRTERTVLGIAFAAMIRPASEGVLACVHFMLLHGELSRTSIVVRYDMHRRKMLATRRMKWNCLLLDTGTGNWAPFLCLAQWTSYRPMSALSLSLYIYHEMQRNGLPWNYFLDICE